MKTTEIIDRLRAQQAELNARGVEHLAVFGSRARGDNRDDSDLDLLLDVERGSRFSLIDVVAIEHRIAQELGFSVGAVMRRSLKRGFAERIANDVVEIF